MARESGGVGKRISATQASRTFSKLLDKIDVVVSRRASGCLAYLCSRSPVVLDDRVVPITLEVARVFGEIEYS